MSNTYCLPQTDMDCFINTEWKNQLFRPNKVTTNFSQMQDIINDEIMEYIDTTSNIQISDLRNSYSTRNKNLQFFKPIIDRINNVTDITSLGHVIRDLFKWKIYSIFGLYIKPNFKHPDVYVLTLDEIDLTLDNSNEYLAEPPSTSVNTLINFVKDMSNFIMHTYGSNIINSYEFVKDVMTLETVCAEYVMPLEDTNKPEIINNHLTYDEFTKRYDLTNFFSQILSDIKLEQVIIPNLAYFDFVSKLIGLSQIQHDVLRVLKNYLIYRVFREYALYLPIADSYSKLHISPNLSASRIYTFMFYKTFGPQLERWYNTKHMDQTKYSDINEMFNKMIGTAINLVSNSHIFSPETRENAIKKLKHIKITIGMGDCLFDLTKFPSLSDCFYTNLTLIAQYYQEQIFKLVEAPINRKCMTYNNNQYSFVVNAYYDQCMNIIYIPAAMIGGTIYQKDTSHISKYSGIGFTIGHEITHALDNHGCDYDYLGHYHNWWTSEDRDKYNHEVQKVIDHYSAYKINDVRINGESTITENIADIVGIKLSLYTYLENYSTGAPRKWDLKYFFYRWAEIFRSTETVDMIKSIIEIDEHSPNVIRINAALSHLDEYYEAFDVKPTDNTYSEKADRFNFI